MLPIDAPAPQSSSFALVVVTTPLFMVVPVPVLIVAPSNGFASSMPEYSWTCTIPNELIGVENVALTEFAPAAMSFV